MTTKINAELVKILSKDRNLRPEADQILERLSVQKDSLPTARQKESLLFCCKLLDSAVVLDDAIQQTLEKVEEKPDAEYVSQPESGIANQVVGTALAPRKDSAPTTNRPMPELVGQNVSIEGVPLDGEAASLWDNLSKAGAAVEAEQLATAPFDGMIETAERIRQQAANLRQLGSNQFLADFSEAFNDPALVERVKLQALGKLPPEWADRLNSKTKD
jgi:hypothetical protein